MTTSPPLLLPFTPHTPVQQRIEKLLSSSKYYCVTKAGELAVQLAVPMIGPDVMKRSGLGDHQGKLRALDENNEGD